MRFYFAAPIAIIAAALAMLSAIVATNALARLVYHVFVYAEYVLDLPPRLLDPALGYLEIFMLFGALTFVSGVIWWYARRVLEQHVVSDDHPSAAASPRRIYNYVVAALAIALFGLTTPGLLDILGQSVRDRRIYTEPIVVQAILVVVAASAWAFHWRGIRRRLSRDDRGSLSRRVYLYCVIGAAAAVILSLVLGMGLLVVLRMLSVPTTTGWSDVWWLPTAAVAAALAVSHWRILRADRAILARPAPIAGP